MHHPDCLPGTHSGYRKPYAIHTPEKREHGAAYNPCKPAPRRWLLSGGQAPSSVPLYPGLLAQQGGMGAFQIHTSLLLGAAACEWFSCSPSPCALRKGGYITVLTTVEFPSRNPPWWVWVLLLGGLCEGWPPTVYFLAAECWAPVFRWVLVLSQIHSCAALCRPLGLATQLLWQNTGLPWRTQGICHPFGLALRYYSKF